MEMFDGQNEREPWPDESFGGTPETSRFSHGYLIETSRFSNSETTVSSGAGRFEDGFRTSAPLRYLHSAGVLWAVSGLEFGGASTTHASRNVVGQADLQRARVDDLGGTIHRRLPPAVCPGLHPRRFRTVRDPQHGLVQICGDGGSSASHRGRLVAAEPRRKCPLRVLVLRPPIHADE